MIISRTARKALRPQESDDFVYVIDGGRVFLMRAKNTRDDIFDNPFATFIEWDNEADHDAYDEL